MTESITDILSGKGADAPAPERLVDEPEAIVGSELDSPAQTNLPEERQEQPRSQEERLGNGKQDTVPLAVHLEERGKNKRYTEALSDVERRLAEKDAADRAQFAQIMQLLQRETQQPPPQPKDQFEDFPGASREALKPELEARDRRLDEMNSRFERNSKRQAIKEYGEETVQEAFAAVQKFSQSEQAKGFVQYLREQSDHPYEDIVQWYNEQKRGQIVRDPRVSSILDKASQDPSIVDRLVSVLNGQQSVQQQNALQQLAPEAAHRTQPTDFGSMRTASPRDGAGYAGPPAIGDILATVGKPRPRTIFK